MYYAIEQETRVWIELVVWPLLLLKENWRMRECCVSIVRIAISG